MLEPVPDPGFDDEVGVEDVSDVVLPVRPDDGRVADGEIMIVGVIAGTVVVTGEIPPTGGAVTRGAMESLLNTQSGPLRSMHAGLASGTL